MNHDGFEMGLHDINNAGVYAIGNDDAGPLSAAMRDAGLRVVQIDLDGCRDKRMLLMRIATRLDFPSGFGGNWDALTDSLRDLAWLPANGYALFFTDADALRAQAATDFDTLLDVLDQACGFWSESNVPFWAFVALQDADVDVDQ